MLIIDGSKIVELEVKTGRTWDPDYQQWFDSFEEWRTFLLGRVDRHCTADYAMRLPKELRK